MKRKNEEGRFWLVEYDFIEENKPMKIKFHFGTEEEAEEWSKVHTDDGKVMWYEVLK